MASVDAAAVALDKLKGSRYLSGSVKEFWVLELMRPLEQWLVRSRMTPNMISVCGLLLTIFAAILISQGALIVGGWFIVAGGCCDFLDGRIARTKGLTSASGAFLDSVLDRYMDFALLVGLGVLFWESAVLWLVVAALLGSTATPYIRAKSEALGIECKGGEMQRPERVALLGIGALLSGYFACLAYPWREADTSLTPYPLILGLGVVALASNKAAIDRFWSTYSLLKSR